MWTIAYVNHVVPGTAHSVHTPKLKLDNTATLFSQVVAKVNPHKQFVRDGADLRAELNISVIEALSGFTRDIHLLNGSTISLTKTGVRMDFGQSTLQKSFALVMALTYNDIKSNDLVNVLVVHLGGHIYSRYSPLSAGGRCPRPSWCREDCMSARNVRITCNQFFRTSFLLVESPWLSDNVRNTQTINSLTKIYRSGNVQNVYQVLQFYYCT